MRLSGRSWTDGDRLDQHEMMKIIEEINPIKDPLYSKRDDISLARLFSEVLRDRARYNTTAKEWYVYDGIRWRVDSQTMTVEQYAKIFGRCLEIYARKIRSENESGSEDYVTFYGKLGSRQNRKRLIEDSRDFHPVDVADFDRDPYLFNCQNCVVNLRTGETLDHDPDLLLSRVSNVWYDPDAKSEDFETFISEIMQRNQSKIKYLRRVFGYSLTGENTQEECYMCYGSTTRNGKSTLLDVIGYMVGDYGSNVEPETLAQRDRNSRGASGDLARLNGVRFLHMSEPPKRMKFDVALLKKLLGRDTITARQIYEREFEFVPVFKLLINTNYLPVVLDDTLFSSGRVKVITFDRHFEPEEQDVHLRRRLESKSNVSGIFNWCLDGLMAYWKEGEVLTVPDAVRSATDAYRQHSDKIQSFIDECLVYDPDVNTTAKDAYDVFVLWCKSNGYGVENKSNWMEDMRSKEMISGRGTVDGRTQRNVLINWDIEYNLKRELYTRQ